MFISIILHTEYTPIVLVHGILSDAYGMEPTVQYIRKYMGNDVHITNVELGLGELTSFTPMAHQLEYLRQAIQSDPKLKNGFNLIAHSQGGLIARAYIENYNNPRVLTYIAWGAPQQGVFGLPSALDSRFKWLNYMESYAHHFLYSWIMQSTIGFTGYWHDSINYKTYLSKSCFLPYLNNERDHLHADLYKTNLCSLKNMVLVMSINEDVIEPRESCHFGFYTPGSKSEVQKIFNTDIYKNDTIGLKTLYESGRLQLLYADCTHENFQEDEKNFVENTLKYLQVDQNSIPCHSQVKSMTATV
jgi:Predicted acetyltransferases and hydrolases with the alpha/beta hydrolase fold